MGIVVASLFHAYGEYNWRFLSPKRKAIQNTSCAYGSELFLSVVEFFHPSSLSNKNVPADA